MAWPWPRGEKDSATCSDCHDGHTILPPTSPASPLHFSRLAETCGACHDQEAKDVEESVHGKAVAAGHRDAPTCTDCHSEHKIEALKSSSSLKISVEVCSHCHASERMNTKYNLPPDRVKTFFESYHGLAAQYGSTLAANCASCHGVHKILPSTDPRSSIYKTNLVVTCGKCHPGATENFAQSKVHVDAAATSGGAGVGEQINRWVRRIYLVLIVGTIGFMLAHNLLLFGKKVRARYRAADLTVAAHEPVPADAACDLGRQFHRPGRDGLCLEVPGFVDRQGDGVERNVPALEPSHRGGGAAGGRGLSRDLSAHDPRGAAARERLPAGQEGPQGRGGQRAVFDGTEPRPSRRSAASATRRRWSIGR